jgi:hypothetical protein
MSSTRTSLRFVVGTTLLAAAGVAAAQGCHKQPHVNTRPERPEPPPEPTDPDRPAEEVTPGSGPIVNTAGPAEPTPAPSADS